MKKLFFSLYFSVIIFISQAQTAQIILSEEKVCKGQQIEATVVADKVSLSTATTGTNNQNGYMFDITATLPATIEDFEIICLSANTTVEVYYKTGTHVGFENNNASWTLLKTVNNLPVGTHVLNLDLNLSIVAGQTLAFYITTTGGVNLQYDNGTSVGSTISADSYLTIKEGTGKSYPFGTSFTPRNFIGKVFYRPAITDVVWNVAQPGNPIIIQPEKSEILKADVTFASLANREVKKAVIIDEIEVAVLTPNGDTINVGQSATIEAEGKYSTAINTTLLGGNNQNGAMFDIDAIVLIAIKGFTINQNNIGAQNNKIEVYYKTGTHVGFEANSASWTKINEFNDSSLTNVYLEISSPIVMVAGQKMAFYITNTLSSNISYSNGISVGSVAASNSQISILEGTGVAYPFGSTFPARVINAIVHYELESSAGMVYDWSNGVTNSTTNIVTPLSTTEYTVSATFDNCTEIASKTIVVNTPVGIEQENDERFIVFPNPSERFFSIVSEENILAENILLYDIAGKNIYVKTEQNEAKKVTVDLENLNKGIYFLKVTKEGNSITKKIQLL